jgi:hypothetical protein
MREKGMPAPNSRPTLIRLDIRHLTDDELVELAECLIDALGDKFAEVVTVEHWTALQKPRRPDFRTKP